jgi:hypothetical protein
MTAVIFTLTDLETGPWLGQAAVYSGARYAFGALDGLPRGVATSGHGA